MYAIYRQTQTKRYVLSYNRNDLLTLVSRRIRKQTNRTRAILEDLDWVEQLGHS